jgi:hypothetical protein
MVKSYLAATRTCFHVWFATIFFIVDLATPNSMLNVFVEAPLARRRLISAT